MSSRRGGEPMVWVVSGPSGSGKTSLCQALLRDRQWRKRLSRSVSFTTRPRRAGEKKGRDYVYVSEAAFLKLKRQGAFLETERVFGCYYGTPKKAVWAALRGGQDALLCIDVKGGSRVRRLFKDNTASIFILPPGQRVLLQRLRGRSTENKKDVEKRLNRVKIEISYARRYDYVVVNDKFDEALEKLKAILLARRCESRYVLRTIGKAD